jgi:hypothetical protein
LPPQPSTHVLPSKAKKDVPYNIIPAGVGSYP